MSVPRPVSELYTKTVRNAHFDEFCWVSWISNDEHWSRRNNENKFWRCSENSYWEKVSSNRQSSSAFVEEVLRGIVRQLESHTVLQEHLEVLSQESRTLQLWVDCLIKPVFLMMIFVRAEREADWLLHLYVVKEIMPYSFAAGHHHYACYRLYLIHEVDETSPR